jgi:hypothetical protein
MSRRLSAVSLFALVTTLAAPSVCRAQAAKIDSKHACLLAREAHYTDDEFAAVLVAHGNLMAGCLISEVSGKEPGAARGEAAAALVQTIATANPPIEAETSLRARQAVVKALHDRSVEVRVATVTALTDFGDESVIPALLSVAKSDPILSLRDYTARAITTIRKRVGERTANSALNDR